MKITHPILLAIFLFLQYTNNVYAAEIILKNTDKITGEIIKEEKDSISVKTEAMGMITVKREFVKEISDAEKQEKIKKAGKETQKVAWVKQVSLGYNTITGNTRKSQLSGSVFINRNRYHVDELTLKGDVYYSSSERKMDAQKWYGMGRYAFSFGSARRWYNFYTMEADHDRFANVDYRLIPSGGIGCWLFDSSKIKLMAEAAAGFEHTNYSDDTKNKNEAVLIPRGFLEWELFKNTKASEDIRLYDPFDDFGEYRLHSETIFSIALNGRISLNLSFINDYNSQPPEDTKKNDLRFISSLLYSF